MLSLLFAATLAVATPPPVPADEAQQLGRRIAEAGDFQAIIGTIAKAQGNELIREHPELLPADRKVLMATAQSRFLSERDVLLDKLGAIYAAYFTLPELRSISAFYASPAGRRYAGRLGETVPAMAAALGKVNFKADVISAFCAKTGKACPAPAGVPAP